ncbi:MAG: relaxase/mobilization nuclease domain-containing protein [Angelakisella sp.]
MSRSQYQYIVCTHVDRDHIHTHIVFNSVSYLTGEKYYGNKKSLWIMREESDRLVP